MPVFLVPALIGGASLAAGGAGGALLTSAWKQGTAAKQRYECSKACFEEALGRYENARKRTEGSVEELLRTAAEARDTLQRAAAFLEKAKTKERVFADEWDAGSTAFTSSERPCLNIGGLLLDIVGAVGSRVAVTTSLTSLAGTIGVASTGTAISSLSGAAATNAILAWLGGGALAVGGGGMALGTTMLGVAGGGAVTLGVGLAAKKSVESFKTDVERTIARMDVAKAEMIGQQAWWQQVWARMIELQQAVTQVKEQLDAKLPDSDPRNREEVYGIYLLAKSLANLLDVVKNEIEKLQSGPEGMQG